MFSIVSVSTSFLVFFRLISPLIDDGSAYSIPTSSAAMNYNSVILVGVVALTSIWWMVHGIKNYAGPRLTHLYIHEGVEQVNNHGSNIPVQSEEKTASSE